MNAALWLRVSTDDQDAANQEPELLALATHLRATIVCRYDVVGSAWKGEHKTSLGLMLADAAAGKFDALLVWRSDRLSRQGGEDLLPLLKTLESFGIKVYSVKDSWLDGTPLDRNRKLVAFIEGYQHEGYSIKLSEATKAGLARRKAKGLPLGRPKGSKDDPTKKRKRTGYVLRQARDRVARLEKEQTKGEAK